MEMKVDPKTMRTADLRLGSYVRTSIDWIHPKQFMYPRHLLTHAMNTKRHESDKYVLRYLKRSGYIDKIFSDENIFTVHDVFKKS